MPESSKLEFLQKFSANNFALSDAGDNTSGQLNMGGIALCISWFPQPIIYIWFSWKSKIKV